MPDVTARRPVLQPRYPHRIVAVLQRPRQSEAATMGRGMGAHQVCPQESLYLFAHRFDRFLVAYGQQLTAVPFIDSVAQAGCHTVRGATPDAQAAEPRTARSADRNATKYVRSRHGWPIHSFLLSARTVAAGRGSVSIRILRG